MFMISVLPCAGWNDLLLISCLLISNWEILSQGTCNYVGSMIGHVAPIYIWSSCSKLLDREEIAFILSKFLFGLEDSIQ